MNSGDTAIPGDRHFRTGYLFPESSHVDPFPILVPGPMRESVGHSPAGPEGPVRGPQDQPASPPARRPGGQSCLPVRPRTPRESAIVSRGAAGDGCTPAATRPAHTEPRAGCRNSTRDSDASPRAEGNCSRCCRAACRAASIRVNLSTGWRMPYRRHELTRDCPG